MGEQKADRGIFSIEKEQHILAKLMSALDKVGHQRTHIGGWV